jgi:hypothetical protein
MRVAEFLGRARQEGLQESFVIFTEQPRASAIGSVLERLRVVGLRVGGDPVVDALPGHAEHVG